MNEDFFHLGVKALIRNPEGNMLLLQINPDKLIKTDDWNGEVYWDIPGGRVEQGVSVEDTLLREVQEETGIGSISSFSPLTTVLSNIRIPQKAVEGIPTVGLILSIYICTVEEASDVVLSEEHTQYEWVSASEAATRLAFKYPTEFVEKINTLT